MKSLLLATAVHSAVVLADGTGFIGLGKTLYNPTCAFACRNVIRGCKLLCTPSASTANHGTAHNPVLTPPDCFVKDAAFLKTMAICLDTYCPISGNPDISLLNDYWMSHLGTGTLGNYNYVPAMSYEDALAAARRDEELARTNTTIADDHTDHSQHTKRFFTADPDITSPLPIIKASQPLNVTSFITPSDWQKQYNGMYDFEANEAGHSYYTLAICLIAILLPLLLSLLSRFTPGSLHRTLITPPLLGTKHRQPLSFSSVPLALLPTRGQSLYITLLSLLNIIFLVAPYVHHHPQSTFISRAAQNLSIIGNRAGVMAMGNAAAIFLFSARNNPLLWITDWSYSTYLTLHRWLGYWVVIHTVLHSVMLWGYYATYKSYAAEFARLYWQWGIVGTVAVVGIWVSSRLVVRQRVYELFLVSHVVLALVFLLGYYYHIWYLYEYNWGYEIWMFVCAGIWAVERGMRVARGLVGGWKNARVVVVEGTDGDYLRIEVEGLTLGEGVAYLSFPGLGWRVWESHPFSVAFNSKEVAGEDGDSSDGLGSPSSPVGGEEKKQDVVLSTETRRSGVPTTTFFARKRSGLTAKLAARAASGSVQVLVFVDGTYPHAGQVAAQLRNASNIVYIAGGVGITALLPYARHISVPSKLFWGTRKSGLLATVQPALASLSEGSHQVEVQTSVGQRLDLQDILSKALAKTDGNGDGLVGIFVCGPPEMADQVRHLSTKLSRNGSPSRPFVLVDEAFAW
ncbi:ferric reductase like transmembrane component-domain-containing protein [Podospora aff. communis PSN243]|uniref:Ferric reductase like transmembrane component-domain-containing protein n=1 Tax=Podospora aff. communis PSN243 TaxID=3040156 RepID=A0AAV9GKT6_9PEZI|nr:ferric reductase like transmembrane component-domain-containing protein [Podospora aff. communis PSN243]